MCCFSYHTGTLDGLSCSNIVVYAMLWVVEEKVDIILLTWIPKIEDYPLREAITAAADSAADSVTSPILVFLPTAAAGVGTSKNFPAGYESAVRVTASYDHDHREAAQEDGVDIQVPVEAVDPVYKERHVHESLSFISTVLAVGVASLVLHQLRIANRDQAVVNAFLQKGEIMRVLAILGSGKVLSSSPSFSETSSRKNIGNCQFGISMEVTPPA